MSLRRVPVRTVLALALAGVAIGGPAHAKRISKVADSYEVAKANALASARSICEAYDAPYVDIESESTETYFDGSVRVVLVYSCSK